MPVLDMPLSKLYEYQGTNPCPSDFDEFWDRSIAEMKAVDPQVKLVKHDSCSKIADLYELWFTSTKNARIFAKLAVPKNIKGNVPAILHFHGLSGAGMSWSSLFKYASQGYVVATMDTRGQGGFSQDVGGVSGTTYTTPFMRGFEGKPEDMLLRDIFLDTAKLAEVVMSLDYVDETRVGAFGGSQGGGLTVACAALVPQIKKIAPCYPYMSDYKRVFDMDLNKGAYEGLKYYFRNFDPRHERETEIFTKLGYIDIQFLAKRIKAEVLMSTGLMDSICPPSTQFAMYNKITSKKSVDIYPDFGHEGLKGADDREFEFFGDL